MGLQTAQGVEQRRQAVNWMLRDLHALERMLADDMFDDGMPCIGAEQEMFLVDSDWRPAPLCMEMLDRLPSAFTTELGAYNLECNLPPLAFDGDCLAQLDDQLDDFVTQADEVATELDAGVVLTGILPTLRKSDLGLHNMAPRRRYHALNEAMTAAAGGSYELHIAGLDEISMSHDSVMLESCCTSFQFHFQISPDEFAELYNLVQALTAPLVAISANSPLLLGRRLWHETRIPLFQQSIDTRHAGYDVRTRSPRVSFGHRWVDDSVLQLFREDIAAFRTLLRGEVHTEPFEMLSAGRMPPLSALQVHNGTVYRWNRACYGIKDNVAHMRIEARAVGSGPTVLDEVANAAFLWGALIALSEDVGDIRSRLAFSDARRNFSAAAQFGLGAQMIWLDREHIEVAGLVLDRLVPAARIALVGAGLDADDVDRYLGVIEDRVESRQNGAIWQLRSLAAMSPRMGADRAQLALTASMNEFRAAGMPVSEWPLAQLRETVNVKTNRTTVEEFMTTDLVTVQPDESVSQVAALMTWQSVRHVPVEDSEGSYVGLISSLDVIGQLSHYDLRDGDTVAPGEVAVEEIMDRDASTVAPETSAAEALVVMRKADADCLPVVRDGALIGIVSERDFMHLVPGADD
jgi:CBS domain-containing protein